MSLIKRILGYYDDIGYDQDERNEVDYHQEEENKRKRIINYSIECIARISFLKDAFYQYDEKIYDKLESSIDIINKIHKKCINDENIPIDELERYHIKYTEHLIKSFEDMFKFQKELESKEESSEEENYNELNYNEEEDNIDDNNGIYYFSFLNINEKGKVKEESEWKNFVSFEELINYLIMYFNIIYDDDFVKNDEIKEFISKNQGIKKEFIRFLGYKNIHKIVYFVTYLSHFHKIITIDIKYGIDLSNEGEYNIIQNVGEVDFRKHTVTKFVK